MHQVATSPAPPKKKKKPFWRRWYIILGVLLLLWIIISSILGKREKPIPVTTEKAVRKTILQTVSATGKVQPEVEVKISPEVAGEIIELPVEDGMAVKKGDLLMKIKPDSYKALVEQQDAAISAAKAINLAAESHAGEDGAGSEARSGFVQQEDDFRVGIHRRANRARRRQIHLRKFTARDRARGSGSSQARDQLSKTTIYSPIDGTITVLNSKLGERVVATNQFAGTEVMRVADLSHMEARVDVNENDVVNVKIGDKAT